MVLCLFLCNGKEHLQFIISKIIIGLKKIFNLKTKAFYLLSYLQLFYHFDLLTLPIFYWLFQ